MGALPRTEGEVSAAVPAFRTRLRWAIAITLYAALTYGATNALAHARGVTRCIALPGELDLPFVAWLVVPYLCIDVLVPLSAIFTRSHTELRTLARRMFWAFTIGNLIFLVLPFRCNFPRTIPDDWTAPFFRLLHFTDLPYNQAPSLHIVEAIVIAPVFLARLPRPAPRAAFLALLVLGSAGTVLTYQHHLLDVVTGAILGFAVVAAVRPRAAQ